MYLCLAMEERLDKLLVQLNLVESRVKAEKLILEVGVHVNGKLINKPGKKFKNDCKIKFVKASNEWVSINANKILAAIKKWKLVISSKYLLDVFTNDGATSEVLLSYDANKVYVNDLIKKNQPSSIFNHDNLIDCTGLFLREITTKLIPEQLDGCVINVSDDKLNKTLPFIHPFLKLDAFVVVVINPKVEVDKSFIKNNGELRNTLGYPSMFDNLKKVAELNNLTLIDYIKSPILGEEGNEEFILYLRKV